jgi:hypothetical protein
MTLNEAKSFLPQLSPLRFQFEHNMVLAELDEPTPLVEAMISLNDWNLLGWTYAEDVPPREGFSYLCMFYQTGVRAWCQISEKSFLALAARYRIQNTTYLLVGAIASN